MPANGFEALKKFDWGTDLAAVAPIDEATIAAHGDAKAREEFENGLLAALQSNLSRDAHDYVCRKLAIVGTAAAVPDLARLLGNKTTSHMARYALERINAPAAAAALREALTTTNGSLKVGVIGSLGARRDKGAVAPLSSVLRDSDRNLARAAALALGAIGNAESASVLQAALHAGQGDKQAVIDGLLSCAEALLAGSQQTEAQLIYQSLCGEQHARLVRLAATRGLLACEANRG